MAERISVGKVALDVVPEEGAFFQHLRPELESGARDLGKNIGDTLGKEIAKQAMPGAAEWARIFKAKVTQELANFRPSIQVELNTTRFAAQLGNLERRLDELSRRRVNIHADFDTAAVLARIRALEAELARLNRQRPDPSPSEQSRRKFDGFLKSVSTLRIALVGLGPAAIPVFASITAATLPMVSAFASAGVGLGAFAFAAKSVLGDAISNSKKLKAAQEAYDKATTKAAKSAALKQQRDILRGMSKDQIKLTNEVGNFSKKWADTKKSITPVVAGALLPWMKAIEKSMRLLKPLITPVAKEFENWGKSLNKYLGNKKNIKSLDDLMSRFGSSSAQNIRKFGQTFINFGKGLSNVFKLAAPNLKGGADAIKGVSESFLKWSSSKKAADQIQSFFDYARKNGPKVKETVKALAGAITQIGKSLGQQGPGALSALTIMLDAISKLPPQAITALTYLFLASATLAKAKAGWDAMKAGIDGIKAAGSGAGRAISWITALPGRLRASTLATKAFALAQRGLNLVMRANPIGLIITAIALLVAGFILAYKKCKPFRDFIDGLGRVVKKVAKEIWQKGLKPAFDALAGGVKWVISFVKKHWKDIQYVADKVKDVAKWVWKKGLKPAFDGIAGGVKWVIRVVKKDWEKIKFFADIIKKVAKKVWEKGIKPAFDGIAGGVRWVINFVKKHWKDIVAIFFGPIGIVVRLIAKNWDKIKGFFHKGIDWVKDKWRSFWNGLKNKASDVWNKIKDGIGSFFDGAKKVFRNGVDAIGRIWDKLKEKAKQPVRFVLDTVLNNGLFSFWNKAMDLLHLGKLKVRRIAMPFADGGIVKYFANGGVENHTAQIAPAGAMRVWAEPETGGEAYIPLAQSKRERSTQILDTVAHEFGYKLAPMKTGSLTAFADGGMWGWIKKTAGNVAGKVVDFGKSAMSLISDPMKWVADKVMAPAKRLINRIPGVDSVFGQAAKEKSLNLASYFKDAIVNAASQFFGSGGANVQAALSWAKTQWGKPYQWGGNGNNSWDCSGYMSAIESVIRGEAPHRRWSTHSFRGSSAPPGWVQNLKSPFMIGVTDAGVGHTAGTLAGVNVESSSGKGVHGGRGVPRGYNDSLFKWRYGFKPAIGGGPGGAQLGGGYRPAVFTSFWDAQTALGGRMTSDTIASSYIPLGSRIAVSVDGKTAIGTVRDLGPAQYVYNRHPGKAVLDLNELMMARLTGSRSNVVDGAFKLLSVGGGRTLYGKRLRGFDSGGYLPPGYSTSYNGTGKYERLYNQHQVDLMSKNSHGDASLVNIERIQLPQGASVSDLTQKLEYDIRGSRRGKGSAYARG